MILPKRHGSTDNYRYGFQGQEKDDEIKGEGNSINTYFRRYDPRIGRWLSPDPKESLMPFETPYSYANNTPIVGNDPDGDICPPCAVLFYYLLTAEGASLAGGALLATYYAVNHEQINRGTQKLARMMTEMEFTLTHNGDTPTMAPGFTSTETPALVVLDTPDLSDKSKEQIVHGMTVVQDQTSGYKPGFDKLPVEIGSGNITTIPIYEPKTKGAEILSSSFGGEIENSLLKNQVESLYKNKKVGQVVIGDGSAMAPAIHTKQTGELVRGTDHIVKLNEVKNGLNHLLNGTARVKGTTRKQGQFHTLNESNTKIANETLDYINKALDYEKPKD